MGSQTPTVAQTTGNCLPVTQEVILLAESTTPTHVTPDSKPQTPTFGITEHKHVGVKLEEIEPSDDEYQSIPSSPDILLSAASSIEDLTFDTVQESSITEPKEVPINPNVESIESTLERKPSVAEVKPKPEDADQEVILAPKSKPLPPRVEVETPIQPSTQIPENKEKIKVEGSCRRNYFNHSRNAFHKRTRNSQSA